jgi:hypothetical protein
MNTIDYLNKYTQKYYNKDYEECDKVQKEWAQLYYDDLVYDAQCMEGGYPEEEDEYDE